MSASLAMRPASTVDALTFTHITASGLNTGTTYRLHARKTGQDTLKSVVFAGPAFTWDNLTFPATGSWTVDLRTISPDASVTTLAVTVE